MSILKLKTNILQIKNHSGFRRYSANTTWLIAEKIIRLLIGLFVNVYVVRYLGPSRFGILNYSMSFVVLFSPIANLGLDSIVIRNIVQGTEINENILGTAFILKISGAVVLFILIVLTLHFLVIDFYSKLLILIIAISMLFRSFNVVDFYFQAQVNARFIAIASTSALFASSIFKLILIYLKASLLWFAIAIVFESGILCIMLLILYHKQCFSFLSWQFKLAIAKEFLQDSWPLILSGFAILIYMRSDQIMIMNFLDSDAVGKYAAAIKLSEIWFSFSIVLTNSLFPAIINAKKVSKILYYARLQKLYDLMVFLAICVALPLTFFSDLIIAFLYGQTFQESSSVLKLHIWTGVFVFLGVASGKWIIAENLQTYTFYRTATGAIINIGLNFILIPKMGIQGAALATLISQAIASYFVYAFSEKTFLTFKMQTISLFWPLRFFLKTY